MVAYNPQGSTAALNAAGYLDSPAGRASYTQDTGATSYPANTSVNFDANGRIISNVTNKAGAGAGVNASDADALRNFFGQTAGFSRDELAEKARQFNATLDWQKQQWQQQGMPELEIEQRAQALREWQAQQDIQLQRSKLGLDYLTTAAQMGGPASVFQQADFLRGARQRGDVPGFLGDLASNTQMPAFTGAGNASIIPQTPGGLGLQLGGGQQVTLPVTSNPAPGVSINTAPAAAAAPSALARETFPEGTWIGLRKDMYGPTDVYGQYVGGVIVPRSQGDYFKAGTPHTIDMTREKFASLQTPAPAPVAAPVAPVAAPAPVAAAAPVGVTSPTAGLGTDPAGYNYDAALNQIGSIFRAGPTSLSPGSLERLDPNELAILKSGATKLGYDPDAWLRAYSRSAIGQTAGSSF